MEDGSNGQTLKAWQKFCHYHIVSSFLCPELTTDLEHIGWCKTSQGARSAGHWTGNRYWTGDPRRRKFYRKFGAEMGSVGYGMGTNGYQRHKQLQVVHRAGFRGVASKDTARCFVSQRDLSFLSIECDRVLLVANETSVVTTHTPTIGRLRTGRTLMAFLMDNLYMDF